MEIEVGKIYARGKGRIVEVISIDGDIVVGKTFTDYEAMGIEGGGISTGVRNWDKKLLQDHFKDITDELKKGLKKEEKMKVETFIQGEIVEHPICIFADTKDTNDIKIGWVYPIKTTQIIDYQPQESIVWITSVYDFKKWNILNKGDVVKLSVLKTQHSNYSPDGKSLKCNIESRERKK